MFRTSEVVAGILVFLIAIGLPAGVTAARMSGAGAPPGAIDVTLHTFENGGFPPEIRVKAGQLVRLRLTSADVTHGFVIGDLGVDAGYIHAGKFTLVEFTPEEPGRYAYVCNARCSPSHSKIRGILVVE